MLYHRERLNGVDARLVSVVEAILLDAAVVYGVRDQASQMLAYAENRSKLQWPNSLHNVCPPLREYAEAVDLAPWPVDWTKIKNFYVLAGAMFQEAKRQGVSIRWGGDFNRDRNFYNDSFLDLAHFELDQKVMETKEV
jgi:peptidoglycan LD-endopeptidase CwlK